VKEIFQKYFNVNNLHLAWERMIRSNGSDSKDQFGVNIFAASLSKNIDALSELLLSGNFQPSRPFKYYEPKASKTQRTKTILSIEDALVYQAIANVVAQNNYNRLAETSEYVFGSMLHPEVQNGTDLLQKKDAEFYFFNYYIPLYNRFVNSINKEIDQDNIKFKLETDITGFFDSIPHSKLLLILHRYDVEKQVLDLLGNCLNKWSGTRDSYTIGVGIPQSIAPSFFLANLLLTELDHIISQKGYTYFRYMDDIRIYDETEENLIDALVLIDNYLKGFALSLNSKKTSIEEITFNREKEKLTLLNGYDINNSEYNINDSNNSMDILVAEQNPNNTQSEKYIIKNISGDELLSFCKKEIDDVEFSLLKRFVEINSYEFNYRKIMNDEYFIKNIINQAYRWRSATNILSQNLTNYKPNEKMIDVWLFCAEYVFWKSNHFCWNLTQYGKNDKIKKKLLFIFYKLHQYEWSQYQILYNLSHAQKFTDSELKALFREAKNELSPLVRLGYFLILAKHLEPNRQLFSTFRNAIKGEKELYIKKSLYSLFEKSGANGVIDENNYWIGI